MKILLLSTAANLVSKHTAFVGVDKKTKEVRCSAIGVPSPRSFAMEMLNYQSAHRPQRVCMMSML